MQNTVATNQNCFASPCLFLGWKSNSHHNCTLCNARLQPCTRNMPTCNTWCGGARSANQSSWHWRKQMQGKVFHFSCTRPKSNVSTVLQPQDFHNSQELWVCMVRKKLYTTVLWSCSPDFTVHFVVPVLRVSLCVVCHMRPGLTLLSGTVCIYGL